MFYDFMLLRRNNISTIYMVLALRRHVVGIRRKHCRYLLIDGVCFWIIFVVSSTAVSRQAWRTEVILSRLHCI